MLGRSVRSAVSTGCPGFAAVVRVRPDEEAAGAVVEMAETIDLAGEARVVLDEGSAQHIALDEIVGQLIERAIERVVDRGIALEYADQDLPVALVVAVE